MFQGYKEVWLKPSTTRGDLILSNINYLVYLLQTKKLFGCVTEIGTDFNDFYPNLA